LPQFDFPINLIEKDSDLEERERGKGIEEKSDFSDDVVIFKKLQFF
jgi:hypothetical protein